MSNVVWNFLKAFAVIFHFGENERGGGMKMWGILYCSSGNNCCSAKDKDELGCFSEQWDLAGGCSLAAASWRRSESREGLVTDLCM